MLNPDSFLNLLTAGGINDFEDLRFKYLVDQGVLEGPELQRRVAKSSQYHAGYFSPWYFLSRFHKEPIAGQKTLKLPFTSAKEGRRPDPNTEWSIKNEFLSLGRNTDAIANEMYRPGPSQGRSMQSKTLT